MKTYTKESLISELLSIRDRGWIQNTRPGNDGGIGNTLEDLLGIEENNLPIPNASEWEMKSQNKNTNALATLFHSEPSPRAYKFVPNILLPLYGWPHRQAGQKYSPGERSFRQTIHGLSRSSRGFRVNVDRTAGTISVSFDAASVDPSNRGWLEEVQKRVGLDELNPQPYWGFDDFFHKAGTKLLNCFYVQADRKREGGKVYFHYSSIMVLQKLSLEKLLDAIERGVLYVDFDARTGHNHGTKFRVRKRELPRLYENVQVL